MVTRPFQGSSDLQLKHQKNTLKHLNHQVVGIGSRSSLSCSFDNDSFQLVSSLYKFKLQKATTKPFIFQPMDGLIRYHRMDA